MHNVKFITPQRFRYLREHVGHLFPVLPNKAPAQGQWNNTDIEYDWWERTLYGVMPHPHVLIIDVDIKNGAQGKESYQRLASLLFSTPPLPNVITPSGGFHIYVDLRGSPGYSPTAYHGLSKHHPEYPGIDFITHGKSYVVCGGQELPPLGNHHGIAGAPNYHAEHDNLAYLTTPLSTLIPTVHSPAGNASAPQATEEQIRELLSYIPSDNYDTWYKVAFALMSTALPRRVQFTIFNDWSSRSPKYSAEACKAKWKSLSHDYDPARHTLSLGSLVYFAKEQHPEATEAISNIFTQPTEPTDLIGIYCDVQSRRGGDRYYHIPSGAYHTVTLVKKNLKPLFEYLSQQKRRKVTLQDLIDDNLIYSVISDVYSPGSPYPVFRTKEGREYVNTYAPSSVPKPLPYGTSDTVSFFLHHATQIFGEKYVNDFLSFVAYLTQNPGKKIRWMLVLQGGKGAGKGLLLNIVKTHVLGTPNCGLAVSTQIKSRYTAWAFDKQLIHIDELMITGVDAQDAMETLKTLITEPTAIYEQKNVSSHERPICTSFVALTNHKGSIRYADPRRYHCIVSPIVNPAEDLDFCGLPDVNSYFSKLGAIASKKHPEGGHLRHFFECYQIPQSFSPDHRPEVSDYDIFKEESHRTQGTDDLMELLKYTAGTDTLPPYASLHELHTLSTEVNPNLGAPFFDEPIKINMIKKVATRLQYSSYGGWLHSNEINPEKAKAAIKVFNYPPGRRPKLTTKQALASLATPPQPTTDTDPEPEPEEFEVLI